MENYEWSKQIEPPSGGLTKLQSRLRDEDLAEREEVALIRYIVAALFLAVVTVSFMRLELPERRPHLSRELVAQSGNIDPARVASENAMVSRLSGVTQKVQIFWLSPSADAKSAE